MKIITSLVLLVIAVATLTACESGKGPDKPATTSAVESAK
jgi:hypothetical protein